MNLPDHLIPAKPKAEYVSEETFRTIIAGPYESGRTVRTSTSRYSLANVVLHWPEREWSVYAPLRDFWHDVRAQWAPFSFQDFLGHDTGGVRWGRVYVGVADGAATAYDLPFRVWTADTIELRDSWAVVDPADYTLSDNALTTPSDFDTWTGFGGGLSAPATPGQADPDGGTDASLLEFATALGPRGIFKAGNANAIGSDALVDIWLAAESGTLPITVWAQDDQGASSATVVTLTAAWQNVTAQVTTVAAGAAKILQIGFTGDQTCGNFFAYNARIRPGRDGRSQAIFDVAPTIAHPLEIGGVFQRVLDGRFADDRLARTVFANDYLTELTLPITEERLDE